jgi:hypothetical protein
MSLWRTNWFWVASLNIFIFRFFETFCEHAPRNKLRKNTNFIIFRRMDQKLWVLEPTNKNWLHKQKNVDRKKKENLARGKFRALVQERQVTASLPPVAARSLTNCRLLPLPSSFFPIFWFFLISNFMVYWRSLGMGLAFWESGCITLPFFEPCPYTWKGEIFHSSFH